MPASIGIAMRNFTRFPELPNPRALVDYGVWVEQLGFESLWVWDHILLGTDPHFPIADALTILTAVAARTSTIKLGTGVLVLPLRNPLLLAKQLATLDLLCDGRFELGAASGWYRREFDAVGVPYNQRGRIMDRNLDIMIRLWTEPSVTAEIPPYNMRQAVMFPKPRSQPHPRLLIGGYVDAVLKRAGQKGDGWLTYFYTPELIHSLVEESLRLRRRGRSRSGCPAQLQPASDHHRAEPRGSAGQDDGMAAYRVGLCRLERIHGRQRHHGNRGRVRRAVETARAGRDPPHRSGPLPL